MQAFDGYGGPQAAAEYGSGAFLMSCVVKQMPADWPDGEAIRQHAADLADAARHADPKIDPCPLSACMTVPEAVRGNDR